MEFIGTYEKLMSSLGKLVLPEPFLPLDQPRIVQWFDGCLMIIEDASLCRLMNPDLGFPRRPLNINERGIISISSSDRKFAGLKDEVLVLGVGIAIEIWNPDWWKKYWDEFQGINFSISL